ncbi:hypothetical protein QJS10_CPA01g02883 [Acorus calamus]|uniref:Uncharacterized protein n=1 Tax=Acorus calamus TaxID=4465 RepID=A0AAV9FFZ8_ACOCL|nr:hypothetical protein QJS10_CPA01g02883 [Acorus calamus]
MSSFPELYSITRDKYCQVNQCWMEEGGVPHWEIRFSRVLSPGESVLLDILLSRLEPPSAEDSGRDLCSWNPSNDGVFTIKGCYGWWRRHRTEYLWATLSKDCWSPKIPLKVNLEEAECGNRDGCQIRRLGGDVGSRQKDEKKR